MFVSLSWLQKPIVLIFGRWTEILSPVSAMCQSLRQWGLHEPRTAKKERKKNTKTNHYFHCIQDGPHYFSIWTCIITTSIKYNLVTKSETLMSSRFSSVLPEHCQVHTLIFLNVDNMSATEQKWKPNWHFNVYTL